MSVLPRFVLPQKTLRAVILLLALGWSAPAATTQYDCGDPSADEQLVLEYINRARANPTAEGQRLGIDITEGLPDPSLVQVRPPLAMNKILLGTARAHSQDMYTNNYFGHNDLNGNTPFDRMTAAGYNWNVNGGKAGENIAEGSNYSATRLEDLLMVDAGVSGRGHRVNLLDITSGTIYREIGVGYYAASALNSQGVNGLITQDFGTSDVGPFLVGVVYSDSNGNNFYDTGEGVSGVTITPDSGTYYAVSSTSGGYAFPIGTSGSLTVTASGGPLSSPVSKTVTLNGVNVKLDFIVSGGGGGSGGAPVISSPTNASGTVGHPFSYQISASNSPTSFNATNLPSWASLNTSSGAITGTPNAAGSTNVTISATNASGTGSATLTITVNSSGGGSSGSNTFIDTDGDGFPDEIEIALGTDPNDPNSTPFGGSPAGPWQSLAVTKLAIKLDFTRTASPGRDSITVTGTLPVPAGFIVLNRGVALDVGGVVRAFALNKSGASTPPGHDSFKLQIKTVKRAVPAQNAKFTAKVTKETFSALLADEGLVGTADAKGVKLNVPVIVIFNGALYFVNEPQLYYAKKGKTGYTK